MERPTSADSPFIGKTPEECFQLLRQLCYQTKSDVDYSLFVVMDEESITDDTVLLVQVDNDESPEILVVRATFEVAHAALSLYLIGDTDVAEDQVRAQKCDKGVLSAHMIGV